MISWGGWKAALLSADLALWFIRPPQPSIRDSAEIDWLRRDAEKRLLQFQALDDIDALQARVDRFATSAGAPPGDWAALVRAGALRGIPADPTGAPYQLDLRGRVSLSSGSALFPLPIEPRRLAPPIS